jgi:hypothetical protein
LRLTAPIMWKTALASTQLDGARYRSGRMQRFVPRKRRSSCPTVPLSHSWRQPRLHPPVQLASCKPQPNGRRALSTSTHLIWNRLMHDSFRVALRGSAYSLPRSHRRLHPRSYSRNNRALLNDWLRPGSCRFKRPGCARGDRVPTFFTHFTKQENRE